MSICPRVVPCKRFRERRDFEAVQPGEFIDKPGGGPMPRPWSRWQVGELVSLDGDHGTVLWHVPGLTRTVEQRVPMGSHPAVEVVQIGTPFPERWAPGCRVWHQDGWEGEVLEVNWSAAQAPIRVLSDSHSAPVNCTPAKLRLISAASPPATQAAFTIRTGSRSLAGANPGITILAGRSVRFQHAEQIDRDAAEVIAANGRIVTRVSVGSLKAQQLLERLGSVIDDHLMAEAEEDPSEERFLQEPETDQAARLPVRVMPAKRFGGRRYPEPSRPDWHRWQVGEVLGPGEPGHLRVRWHRPGVGPPVEEEAPAVLLAEAPADTLLPGQWLVGMQVAGRAGNLNHQVGAVGIVEGIHWDHPGGPILVGLLDKPGRLPRGYAPQHLVPFVPAGGNDAAEPQVEVSTTMADVLHYTVVVGNRDLAVKYAGTQKAPGAEFRFRYSVGADPGTAEISRDPGDDLVAILDTGIFSSEAQLLHEIRQRVEADARDNQPGPEAADEQVPPPEPSTPAPPVSQSEPGHALAGMFPCEVSRIRTVRNFRRHFDEERLAELTTSVRTYGILEPLVVRQADEGGDFELIAGERRLRAARAAGLTLVPVRVLPVSRQVADELQLLENVQRQDLTPVEEAEAYQVLMAEYGYSQERLAERFGHSQSYISTHLALLRCPPKVQHAVITRVIAVQTARALATWIPEGVPLPVVLQKVADRLLQERPPAAGAVQWVARQVTELAPVVSSFDWHQECTGQQCPHVKGARDRDVCPYLGQLPGRQPVCLEPNCYSDKETTSRWRRWGTDAPPQQPAREAPRPAQPPAAPARPGSTSPSSAAPPAPAAPAAPAAATLDQGAAPTQPEAPATPEAPARPGPTPVTAPAMADADVKAAARLRELGARHWDELTNTYVAAGVEYQRECYLPLGDLLQHWEARAQLDAGQMPRQFREVGFRVPEQGLWHNPHVPQNGSGQFIAVRDGTPVIDLGNCGIEDLRLAGPVYYRVWVSAAAPAHRSMRQMVVIPCGTGRHIVIGGPATVLIRKELAPKWFDLINTLPGLPAAAAAD